MLSNYKGLLSLATESRSGLESKFDRFRQNIELTENQKTQIITSHQTLRAVIDRLDYVKKTFLTGSYYKSTMIRPPNDVDIFVVLTDNQANLQPQSVLDKLKRDIGNISTYAKSTIRQDHPCVVVDLSHCKFELTPAIHVAPLLGGGYKIPERSGFGLNWKQIEDPINLASRLTAKNAQLGGKLVPLIKMMKQCKAVNAKICNIKSFEMEEVAINGLHSVSSYRDGVQKLLRLYNWSNPNIQNYHYALEHASDVDFAKYCRDELFGKEFPE